MFYIVQLDTAYEVLADSEQQAKEYALDIIKKDIDNNTILDYLSVITSED